MGKTGRKKGDAELKLALKNNELTAIPFFALRDSLGNLAEGNIKFNKGASLKEIRLTSLKRDARMQTPASVSITTL